MIIKLLILLFLIPLSSASTLYSIVTDTNNNPIPDATISYQNSFAKTDQLGIATISNITPNTNWLFTVSADNYNIYTESIKFPIDSTINKTFILTPIESNSPVITSAPAIEQPPTDINVRIHITDPDSINLYNVAVNLNGKLRYTNINGDVDFPMPKNTKTISVSASYPDYSSFSNTYNIPDTLINDDYRIEIQLPPVSPETGEVPSFDLTKLSNPNTKKSASNDYILSVGLILTGIVLIIYPSKRS